MSMVYDNWERLVGAIFKREELRQLALCLYPSSSFSSDFSLDPSTRHVSELISGPYTAVSNNATGSIAGGVAAGAVRLFAAPAIALAWYRRRKPENHFLDVPGVHMAQLKRFSLRELLVASDNLNAKNILGRGGFGNVYKVRLADGSLVAINRMKEWRIQFGELQFQIELEITSMTGLTAHQNLLRLRGFCMTRTEGMLFILIWLMEMLHPA